jgi:chromosome segregation ATPase
VSSSEYEEIALGMREAQSELERAALEDEVPNKERQAERSQTLKKLADALARLRELERSHEQGGELADALTQMNKGTKQLLAAIIENTKTTNALLTVSNARLAQLEQEVVSGDETAFPADPKLLAEGDFLSAQLAGIQGTEEPRPLFKDAQVTPVVGGFDLITSTVCATCADGVG